MYRVFIVDDEPFIIEGLYDIIDWAALGLEIVGHAVERLDTLRCFRRAVQGNADSIVALAKATGARSQGMQRSYATAKHHKRHPQG